MNELNDVEFSIMQAFEALGGEADVGAILERVEASPRTVRRAISRLRVKEDLIEQSRRPERYSMSFVGRERYLYELSGREPKSPVLKRERKRTRLIYAVTVEALEEGVYLATCDAIPGCLAEGATVAEALLNLEDGAVDLLKLRKQHKQAIPDGIRAFSGAGDVVQAQLIVPVPE